MDKGLALISRYSKIGCVTKLKPLGTQGKTYGTEGIHSGRQAVSDRIGL